MKFAAVAILLAGAALAAPLRSNGSEVVCGSDDYTTAQIQAAAKAACAYVNNDEKAGSSKYPEKYNDYEGFTFHGVEGPYYEFPIMKSGKVYTGGKAAITIARCSISLTTYT